jgi:hypothetical protein
MNTRSRIAILSYICQFSLSTVVNNYSIPALRTSSFIENRNPDIGSLVVMTSAPTSKWYISWVIDYRQKRGGKEYLLESIEDGELCWWSNISIYELYPETVKKYQEWRWTDEQHKFNDRWFKVKKREKSYSLFIPVQAIFDEDDVILGIREKFSTDVKQKYFINWKKLKLKDMIEYFESVKGEFKEK